MIPAPWHFALLALGAYRLWRLVAVDEITATVRDRVTGRDTHRSNPAGYNMRLDRLIGCAWCAGFWVSLAVWGCWQWQPHLTLLVAVPFAINAVVGLVTKNLDA